ncbi:trans-sialidase, putative, partial [Trypanosoma cruzi marinkellei]
SSAAKGTSTGTAYSAAMPRTGLVGFLSGNYSDDTWRDEYLGVDATVIGAATVKERATESSGGVKFQGACAEWPVGRQGENQPYHFANYNFTLVATVSIHNVPKKGNIPLMGVYAMDGDGGKSTVLLGLSYSKEKKWKLLCSDGEVTEHSSSWEANTTYQVAIVLQNENQSSVYVDGKRVGGDSQCELETTDSKEVSHFYIGGDGRSADNTGSDEVVSLTVTNVLLYNRPLTSEEIDATKPNKASILVPEKRNAAVVGTSLTAVNRPAVQKTVSVPSPGGPAVNQESSTSSGENGEMAGETDGQEEGANPQVRDANAAALNSNFGNVSQGNNSDAGTVRENEPRPLLLLLLLGLWGLAAP